MTKVEAKSHEKSVREVEEAVDAYVNGKVLTRRSGGNSWNTLL